MRNFILLGYIFLLFYGCNDHRQVRPIQQINLTTQKDFYAKGYSIEYINKIKILRVYNPWQGAKDIHYTYVLSNNIKNIPDSLKNYPFIQTPVKKIICLSTTHIGFIDCIGETSSIKGISNSSLVNNPYIISQLEKKEIIDIGFDQQLYFERILEINPDVVFVYAVSGEIAGSMNKLKELGIRPVYISEYLENEPLAKSEWIKFFAVFFNKDSLAESKFNEIEEEYLEIISLNSKVKARPVVLSGLPWKGMWHLPGGRSFAAQLIADAGGTYAWSENNSHESFIVDFEEIIYKSKDFDTWINCGIANSLEDIVQQDERLISINALKKKNVYNNNKRINKNGGNDYWESGVVAPHIILKDLFAIFHPELIKEHNFVYYKKLQ